MRGRRRAAAALAVAVALAAGGCAGRRPPPPGPPPDLAAGWEQRGVASWYGPGFHGRTTANGETYDMHAMTAAHPWLPFDSLVEVENLDNGRSTRVRINDRGPFVGGRILDLSRSAAEALGMIGPGTARVRIRLVGRAAATGPAAVHWVQAGAFRDRVRARDLARRLRRDYGGVEVEAGADGWHRVVIGPFGERERAEAVVRRLSRAGIAALVR